jgi:hypothetical protein
MKAFATPPALEDIGDTARAVVRSAKSLCDVEDSAFAPLPLAPGSSPFVKSDVARQHNVLKSEVVIDTSARRALAWFFLFCGRERMRVSRESGELGERAHLVPGHSNSVYSPQPYRAQPAARST